jgi:fructose-bisphosphate aldolase, class II
VNKLKLKPGIVTGDALQELFAYCKETQCALPAINSIGSHVCNAAMAAAREAGAPIIIQFSHTGAQFVGGKSLDNGKQQASIYGAIAGALHVRTLARVYGVPVVLHTDHAAKKLLGWVDGLLDEGEQFFEKNKEPLFSSHMLDLSEEPVSENIALSSVRLQRMAKMKMTLEIELGVTGGEEDGVDNSGVEHSKLYTRPEDVLAVYDALGKIGTFTVAASFGNTHGVYAPGNVKLKPTILRDSQQHIEKARGTKAKPVNFVFHGGSGSSQEEIREAVSYGVVKMNIDTDTQWAFLHPIKKYMDDKSAYLQGQIGNPEGADQPNKKHIDPRGWLYLGEKGVTARLVEAFKDLGAYQKFEF